MKNGLDEKNTFKCWMRSFRKNIQKLNFTKNKMTFVKFGLGPNLTIFL